MDETLITRLAKSCLYPLKATEISESVYDTVLDNVTDAIRGAYGRGLTQQAVAQGSEQES